MVGASLTGLTVTTNESVEISDPSSTLRVIVVEPDWLVAGSRVTVRVEPLPPNVIFDKGMSPGLEEEAVSTNELAGVSASPIVKLIGPKTVSSGVL